MRSLPRAKFPRLCVHELLRNLVLLLAPFAPFLAAELWEELGETVQRTARALAREQSRTGEGRRDRDSCADQRQARHAWCACAAEAGYEDIEAAALADEKVQARIAGKTVVKIIVVPRKLVNLVVK